MADTVNVTFTRPVRVHKKRHAKGASASVDADIAEVLIELGAAVETPAPQMANTKADAKEPGKKA